MTATPATSGRVFCVEVLPKVSRTFAVCIRLLPTELEHPVLVAYLLCRIADTFEDTTRLSVDERTRLLAHFRGALDDRSSLSGYVELIFRDFLKRRGKEGKKK